MPPPPERETHAFNLTAGDTVQVRGLTSSEGQRLNGREGSIRSIERTGRFGVEVHGVGMKAIKGTNLAKVTVPQAAPPTVALGLPLPTSASASEVATAPSRAGSYPTGGFSPADDLLDEEELLAQAAIQSSLQDVIASSPVQQVPSVNAQVSDALLRSRLHLCPESQVVLLTTFSRSPDAFRQALTRAPEVADCRRALEVRGFPPELRSGAKVLVPVEHYEPLMEAIRLTGFDPDSAFGRQHVFVDPPLAPAVTRIVDEVNASLSKKKKFYKKGDPVKVPLGLATEAVYTDYKVGVLNTFIGIRVPSSLRSAETSSGPRTVSTTDAADGRKGPNHRKRRPSGYPASESGSERIRQ